MIYQVFIVYQDVFNKKTTKELELSDIIFDYEQAEFELNLLVNEWANEVVDGAYINPRIELRSSSDARRLTYEDLPEVEVIKTVSLKV